MSKPRVITIGISGPSCSGKTTLALTLKKLLHQTIVINQDEFFKPDDQIPVDEVTGLANWDSPEAVDFHKLNQEIIQARLDPLTCLEKAQADSKPLQNNHDGSDSLNPEDFNHLKDDLDSLKDCIFIIVEGFLLFCNEDVYSNLDIKLFTMASKEVLKERRESREGYVTLQGYWVDPPDYFEQVVWPQFLKWNQHLLIKTEKDKYHSNVSDMPTMTIDTTDLYRFDTDSEPIIDVVSRSVNIIKQWKGV